MTNFRRMKKFLLSFSLFWVGLSLATSQSNVTFSVDMMSQAGNYDAVYVFGGFQGWQATDNQLLDDGVAPDANAGDGIFTGTFSVPNTEFEYKFIFENTGGGGTTEESLTDTDFCTEVFDGGAFVNRYLRVSEDLTLPTVCWESCSPCSGVTQSDVTFELNMNCYNGTIGAGDNVYINGHFGGWSGSDQLMYDDGTNGDVTADDNIYTITLTLDNVIQQYKYTINDWGSAETLIMDEPCTYEANGNINRFLIVEGNATREDTWSSCSTECIPTSDITFCVDVNCFDNPPSEVSVFGSFNGWMPGLNPLADDGMNGDMAADDGVWCGTYTIIDGDYEFKFFTNVTNDEIFTPGDPCTVTSGAFTNRTLTVAGNATESYGWASCNATCETPPPSGNIMFCVDVSCLSTLPSAVSVFGSFNGWDAGANPLANTGGNIWCGTYLIPYGDYEFKFFTDVAGDEKFNEGASCTVTNSGFTNRTLTVDGNATESYGLNSCDMTCAEVYDIELCVDVSMASCQPNTTSPAYVSGAFNGWSGTASPLTDNGNGYVCTTLKLPNGTYPYKFTINDWTEAEAFFGGEPCTGGPNHDRQLVVDGANATYSYAWNSCNTECSVTKTVSFCVDLGCQGTINSASVIGNFNNWDPATTPLIQQGGTDFYCTSLLTFNEGSTLEFLYIANGLTEDLNETEHGACTVTTNEFTNRVVLIDGSTPEPIGSGFNSCDNNCALLAIELTDFNGYAEREANVLEWTTQKEVDNAYFEIEHSTDGLHFSAIGKVEGAGSTSTVTNYQFMHQNPVTGIHYYRLRQVDFSGLSSTTDVVEIHRRANDKFDVIIRPNIVESVATLDFIYPTEAESIVEVFDIQGKRVLQQNIPAQSSLYSLEMATFGEGHYLLRITTGSESIVRRFVKI